MSQIDLTNYLEEIITENELEKMSIETGLNSNELKGKLIEKLEESFLLTSSRAGRNSTSGDFSISVITGLSFKIKYTLTGSSVFDWSLKVEIIVVLVGQEVSNKSFSFGPNNLGKSIEVNGGLFEFGAGFEVKASSSGVELNIKAKGCVKKPAISWKGWEWQCAKVNETLRIPFE